MKKIIFYALTINVFYLLLISLYAANASDMLSAQPESSSKNPPKKIVLNRLTDVNEPVKFDHAVHEEAAKNCALCHHVHGDYEPLKCNECHKLDTNTFKKSVDKGFLPCRGCHKSYDPAHPEFPGLKAAYHGKCFQCHRGMENAGVDPKLLARVKRRYEIKGIERVGTDPKGCTKTCHPKRERIASWR